MPITTVFVKGESLPVTLQENVQHTLSSTEYINYLAFHSRVRVPVKQTNKQNQKKKQPKYPIGANALG